MRQLTITVCSLMGLGFCWCAEEMLAFCVSYTASGADSTIYLYGVYMPIYSLCAFAFLACKPLERLVSRPPVVACLAVLGIFGVLIVALFARSMAAVLLGVAMFALAAVPLNYCWVLSASRLGSKAAGKMVVATAGMTCASTLLWGLPVKGLFLLSAAFLALSFAMWLIISFSEIKGNTKIVRSSKGISAPFSGAHHPAALVGMGVLAMGFGFLQYTAYHFATGGELANETVAHAFSFVLLVLVTIVLKDSDHSFSLKLSVTLMLFAYVMFSALHGAEGFATVLAAGTEGMFELILLLILTGFIERGIARPGFLFGGYGLLLGVSQLAGSALSIVEHVLLPSDSYSAIGLLLVALLIIAAVWLLNDKTIAEFLWSGSRLKTEGGVDRADEKEKLHEIAQSFCLTPREAEVLELLGKGRSSSFIAEHFCVSNNTVRSHILHIYSKLDVHSRQELITLLDEWEPPKAIGDMWFRSLKG